MRCTFSRQSLLSSRKRYLLFSSRKELGLDRGIHGEFTLDPGTNRSPSTGPMIEIKERLFLSTTDFAEFFYHFFSSSPFIWSRKKILCKNVLLSSPLLLLFPTFQQGLISIPGLPAPLVLVRPLERILRQATPLPPRPTRLADVQILLAAHEVSTRASREMKLRLRLSPAIWLIP